jgi:hypothetical protein
MQEQVLRRWTEYGYAPAVRSAAVAAAV